MTIDFAGDKQRYALADWIEKDLGAAEQRSGKWRLWCCPFHDDAQPSFAVDTSKDRWTCFSGCGNGDILDYIQMRQYGSISKSGDRVLEAYKTMTGQNFLPPVSREQRVIHSTEGNAKPPTMDDVKQAHQWWDVALPYFSARMVTEGTVHDRMLGAWERNWCQPHTDKATGEREWYGYKTAAGEKFTVSRKHYTIPYMVGSQLRGIQTRRDDAWVSEYLKTERGQHIYEQVVCDMAAKKGCDITEIPHSKVVDKLFGAKYCIVAGSVCNIFGVEQLLRIDAAGNVVMDNGYPVLNRLPYVITVESEIGAMSLIDAGYPTIAVRSANNIARLLSKVGRVIIAGDNDIDHLTADGEVWNPGKNKANALRVAIGRGDIIYPDDPHKDANEVAIAGEIAKWLSRYNISPVLPIKAVKAA